MEVGGFFEREKRKSDDCRPAMKAVRMILSSFFRYLQGFRVEASNETAQRLPLGLTDVEELGCRTSLALSSNAMAEEGVTEVLEGGDGVRR